MFLSLLTEDSEKKFFLNFAYLLAVAEEENQDSHTNPARECTFSFSMKASERLMLTKLAEEMGISEESCAEIIGEKDSERISIILNPLENIVKATKSISSIAALANPLLRLMQRTTVPAMLSAALEEHDNATRSSTLRIVLEALCTQANVASFAIEKRKAILMEATAMAYADGTIAAHERVLLINFCELCQLDATLLDEFQHITMQLADLYRKGYELITE